MAITRSSLTVGTFVLGTLLVGSIGFAQIPTKPVTPSKATTETVFDGSRNFLGSDVHAYLGQDLFIPCKAESLREYG